MVHWLADGGDPEDDPRLVEKAKTELARVLSALANSEPGTTLGLVQERTLDAILHCLGNVHARSGCPELEAALCKALRSIVSTCCLVFGTNEWGLQKDYTDQEREDAHHAVSRLFRTDALRAFMPSLAGSTEAVTAVADLLYSMLSCWDTPPPKRAITGYLPPDLVRTTRSPSSSSSVVSGSGWESGSDTRTANGWAVDKLLQLLEMGHSDAKTSALMAISALSTENATLATNLARTKLSGGSTFLSEVFFLTTSRDARVQFAAVLCATRFLRSLNPNTPVALIRSNRTAFNPMQSLVLIYRDCISDPQLSDEVRSRYIFAFGLLLADSPEYQDAAASGGALTTVLNILRANRPTMMQNDQADDVPLGIIHLREACFRFLATATMTAEDYRRRLLDDTSGTLYTTILAEALDDAETGIRYAACQGVRALSRSIEVLRTNVVDSGLGMKLWDLLKTEQDRRVQIILLMCISNLILDFSPLREVLFERGVIETVVQFMDHDDGTIQLNAVWAIRNTLYRASAQNHRDVFNVLGMDRFYRLLMSDNPKVRQQSLILLRNTATLDESCSYLCDKFGPERLFGVLTEALNDVEEENVIQAVNALDNMSRHISSDVIVEQTEMLDSLKCRLRDSNTLSLKKTILSIILSLAKHSEHVAKRLKERGFVSAVQDIQRTPENEQADVWGVAQNILRVFSK